jgi:hypothetical protein
MEPRLNQLSLDYLEILRRENKPISLLKERKHSLGLRLSGTWDRVLIKVLKSRVAAIDVRIAELKTERLILGE